MDLDMPTNGFTAAKEIQSFYRKKNIDDCSIAAHSAAWDHDAMKLAKKCGMNLALPKPLK